MSIHRADSELSRVKAQAATNAVVVSPELFAVIEQAQRIAACTVIAPTCAESDVWTTACFVIGAEPSLARFGERFAIRFTLVPTIAGEAGWTVRQTESFQIR